MEITTNTPGADVHLASPEALRFFAKSTAVRLSTLIECMAGARVDETLREDVMVLAADLAWQVRQAVELLTAPASTDNTPSERG